MSRAKGKASTVFVVTFCHLAASLGTYQPQAAYLQVGIPFLLLWERREGSPEASQMRVCSQRGSPGTFPSPVAEGGSRKPLRQVGVLSHETGLNGGFCTAVACVREDEFGPFLSGEGPQRTVGLGNPWPREGKWFSQSHTARRTFDGSLSGSRL